MRTGDFIFSVLILFFSLFLISKTTRAQDSLYLIGTITGESTEHQISAPAGIGDINGDGYDDFMVTRKTGVQLDPTVVELYLGSPDYDLNADIIFHYPGNDYYHYLGGGFGIGDVNNDGYDDFVLAGSIGPITTNKVYLYFGGETIDTIPICEFVQPYSYDEFGYPIEGLGDINKDGYDDFVICSPYNWDNGKGYVYLFWGGDTISWDNSITLSSDTMEDFFGQSVANIGDINNDNFDDIAVGAPVAFEGHLERVFIYYGGIQMDNIPDTILVSGNPGDEFGRIIKNAGDINSDGITDFCITSFENIFIYTTHLYNPLMINGYSIDADGDINKDGYSDLIVGDDWKIKIYLGSENFDTYYDLSIDDVDSIGFTANISIAGDINNDGYDEIFAFAPYFPEPDLGKLNIYSYKEPSGVEDLSIETPYDFRLCQNYPNPFNSSTNITYSIPQYGLVTLKVYNLLGEEVAALINKEKPAGTYEIKFSAGGGSAYGGNGSGLPSGVYIYKLMAGSYSAAKKLLLLK